MRGSWTSTSERRCPHCGYDLAGLHVKQRAYLCPECGQPVEWGRWLTPWPPKWRVCLWLIALPVVFAAAGAVPWILGAALSATKDNVLNAIGVIIWCVCLATALVAPFKTAAALARAHQPQEGRNSMAASIGAGGVLLASISCSIVAATAVLLAELL